MAANRAHETEFNTPEHYTVLALKRAKKQLKHKMIPKSTDANSTDGHRAAAADAVGPLGGARRGYAYVDHVGFRLPDFTDATDANSTDAKSTDATDAKYTVTIDGVVYAFGGIALI